MLRFKESLRCARFDRGGEVSGDASFDPAAASRRRKRIDRSEELPNAAAIDGRGEEHRWCIVSERQARSQSIGGNVRARSVGLVHDNEVRALQQTRLHRLHLVAAFGPFDEHDDIGETRNAEISLPGPDRLDEIGRAHV